MKVKYFNQKPSADFEILDRIKVIYSESVGKPFVEIYPFRVKAKGKEYNFTGLNSGAWTPVIPCAILGEIDESDRFFLTVVTSDMIGVNNFDPLSTPLGIVMYLDNDEITVINHQQEGK